MSANRYDHPKKGDDSEQKMEAEESQELASRLLYPDCPDEGKGAGAKGDSEERESVFKK